MTKEIDGNADSSTNNTDANANAISIGTPAAIIIIIMNNYYFSYCFFTNPHNISI